MAMPKPPGPLPAAKRRRTNVPATYGLAEPVKTGQKAGKQPELGFDAHPMVARMWAALGRSVEPMFFSEADWERAAWELYYANLLFTGARQWTPVAWSAVQHGLSDLLVSAADKRRAGIELKAAAGDPDAEAAVADHGRVSGQAGRMISPQEPTAWWITTCTMPRNYEDVEVVIHEPDDQPRQQAGHPPNRAADAHARLGGRQFRRHVPAAAERAHCRAAVRVHHPPTPFLAALVCRLTPTARGCTTTACAASPRARVRARSRPPWPSSSSVDRSAWIISTESKLGGCVGKRVAMPLIQIAAVSEEQTKHTMRMVRAFAPKNSRLVREKSLDPGLTRYYSPDGELAVMTSSGEDRGGRREHFHRRRRDRMVAGRRGRGVHEHPGRQSGQSRALGWWRPRTRGNRTPKSQAQATWEGWVKQEEDLLKGEQPKSGSLILYDAVVAPPETDLADPVSLRAALEFVYADCHWKTDREINAIMTRIWDRKRSRPDDSKRKYLNWPVVSEDAWCDPQNWAKMHRSPGTRRRGAGGAVLRRVEDPRCDGVCGLLPGGRPHLHGGGVGAEGHGAGRRRSDRQPNHRRIRPIRRGCFLRRRPRVGRLRQDHVA